MGNPTTFDHFWERIDRSGECWTWTGAKLPTGYGRLRIDRGWVYAHRLVYEVAIGPIPNGLFVCHRCDNPPCCRPSHLFLGTASDNSRDRESKGRGGARRHPEIFRSLGFPHGERHPRARLNADVVLAMRRLRRTGATFTEIAGRFRVSVTTATNAIKGTTWGHVPFEAVS